jgi:hypothetical protein
MQQKKPSPFPCKRKAGGISSAAHHHDSSSSSSDGEFPGSRNRKSIDTIEVRSVSSTDIRTSLEPEK